MNQQQIQIPLSISKGGITQEEYTFLVLGSSLDLTYKQSLLYLSIFRKYNKIQLMDKNIGHNEQYDIRRKAEQLSEKILKDKEDVKEYCDFLPKRKTSSVITILGKKFYLIKKNVYGKSTQTIQAYRMTDGRYLTYDWDKNNLIKRIKERIRQGQL